MAERAALEHADVATLGKLALDFRLIAAALASLVLLVEPDPPAVVYASLMVAMAMSVALVFAWERLAPFVARHPAVVFADVAVSVGLVLLTGLDGPLLYYALGTAFLGGVLFGYAGGLLVAALLVSGYGLVAWTHVSLDVATLGFQELVAVPALFVLAAAGAAAVRRLLLDRACAQAAVVEAQQARAVSEDRARLARELHDSLGKTLHGLALAASALPAWTRSDPERAAAEASRLHHAAHQAAREARELLTTLRTHRLDRSLPCALAELVERWQAATGIAAHLDLDEAADVLSPEARHQLLSIASEALRNVQRHAEASAVWVRLHLAGDGGVRLAVADDGVGVDEVDLDRLVTAGHYGLAGMAERAERLGGCAAFARAPAGGLQATVEVGEVADLPDYAPASHQEAT